MLVPWCSYAVLRPPKATLWLRNTRGGPNQKQQHNQQQRAHARAPADHLVVVRKPPATHNFTHPIPSHPIPSLPGAVWCVLKAIVTNPAAGALLADAPPQMDPFNKTGASLPCVAVCSLWQASLYGYSTRTDFFPKYTSFSRLKRGCTTQAVGSSPLKWVFDQRRMGWVEVRMEGKGAVPYFVTRVEVPFRSSRVRCGMRC